jgi:hypothetical protein
VRVRVRVRSPPPPSAPGVARRPCVGHLLSRVSQHVPFHAPHSVFQDGIAISSHVLGAHPPREHARARARLAHPLRAARAAQGAAAAAAAAAYTWFRRAGAAVGAAGAVSEARRAAPGAAQALAAARRAPLDPGRVAAGAAFGSAVRACMYPSMTCKEQRASARALCRDDPYWLRAVEGFRCSGGFARPAPSALAAGDRWERVGHFVVSAAIAALAALLLWTLVRRAGAAVGGGGGGGGPALVTL